jgi:hypothetical protein
MSFLISRSIPLLCAFVVLAGANGVTNAQASSSAAQSATVPATAQPKPQLEPKAIEILGAEDKLPRLIRAI